MADESQWDSGFVYLHRRLRDHWIAQDPAVLSVFIQILLRVEWSSERKKVFFHGSQVSLGCGEMSCGRKQLANWAGVSERECRTALNKLKTTNTIAVKTSSKFSLITLVNWGKYQRATFKTTNKTTSKQSLMRPTSDQQTANQRPHLNNQSINKGIIKSIDPLNFSEEQIHTLRAEIANALGHGIMSMANEVNFQELIARVKSHVRKNKIDNVFAYTLTSARALGKEKGENNVNGGRL